MLPPEKIHEICHAAMALGLSRPVLLASIDPDIIKNLPSASSPEAQTFSDLQTLNQFGQLANGSVPLDIWLKTAAKLAHHRPDFAIFEQARRLITTPQSDANPITIQGEALSDSSKKPNDENNSTTTEPFWQRHTVPMSPNYHPATISLFISYSRKDDDARVQLLQHLALIRRQGIIREWHDRMIGPGEEWSTAISAKLDAANLILLLVSKHFLASDFCYGVEMKRAMERHARGQARVVPIIVTPCDLFGAPFMRLQALPTDAKPISMWGTADEAWANVAAGIRVAAEDLLKGPNNDEPETQEQKPTVPDIFNADTLSSQKYAEIRPWLTDTSFILSSVLSIDGGRRLVRTFYELTFATSPFLLRFVGRSLPWLQRESHLTPITTVIWGNCLLMGFGAIAQLLSPGKSFRLVDLPPQLALAFGATIPVAIAIRTANNRQFHFGECLAIACYLQGSMVFPAISLMSISIILIFLGRFVIGLTSLVIFNAILGALLVIYMLAIPWLIARSAAAIAARKTIFMVPFFAITIYLVIFSALAIRQPGSAALMISSFCAAVGNMRCAEAMSATSIKLQPEMENLWITRMNTLAGRGDKEEMARVAKAGLVALPDSAWMHFYVAEWASEDERSRAEPEYRSALTLNPSFAEAASELAYSYVNWHAYPEVIEHCSAVLANPRFGDAVRQACFWNTGIGHYYLNQYDEARRQFDQIDQDNDSNFHHIKSLSYKWLMQYPSTANIPKKVVIVAIAKDSLAARIGIAPGAILLKLDEKEVGNTDAWQAALSSRSNTIIPLTILTELGPKTIDLPGSPPRIGVTLQSLP